MNNIQKALNLVQNQLADFVDHENFWDNFELAFGTNYDREIAQQIKTSLETKTFVLPRIEVLDDRVLGNAQGAFAGSNDKIYLSDSLIDSGNIQQISAVILEEFGHWIDFHINAVDRPGDEGELFAAILQGENISEQRLAALKTENDGAVITIDRQTIQIEQATFGENPGFDLIGLTQLRNDPRFAGIDGSGFSVAVIDSGLDRTHRLLSTNYRTGFDFVDNDTNPNDGAVDGHGTHVAGTIGARDETIGVATDVDLIGLRVLGNDGKAKDAADIRDALNWVLDNRQQHNIIAVNMSLASSGFYTNNAAVEAAGGIVTEINDIINRLETAGVTVVAAAGNNYDDIEGQKPGVAFPAISSSLNIGAVWKDRLISSSQRFDDPNNIYDTLFAPGALIKSTVPGGETKLLSGTSMASPHVAGAVALMQEAAFQFGGRLLSTVEVVSILRSTADRIFDGGDENDNVTNTNTFYGRMNVYKAISEIKRRFDTIDFNGLLKNAVDISLGTTINPYHLKGESISADNGKKVGPGDVDLFKVIVPDNGKLFIDIDTPFDQEFVDSYLRIFDANGNQLAFNDDNRSTNINGNFTEFADSRHPNLAFEDPISRTFYHGHTSDSFAVRNVQRGKVYYIGVSDDANKSYDLQNLNNRPTSGNGGLYDLKVQFLNNNRNGSSSQAVSALSLPITSQAGTLGTDTDPQTGQVFQVGNLDVDFVEIQSATAGILELDIDSYPQSLNYTDTLFQSSPQIFLDNSLYGGDGNDQIFGGCSDDITTALAMDCNDTIYGQGGNDIISGGTGNDIFAYNASLPGATTLNSLFGLDTISDFTSTQDRISLSQSTFSAISTAVGAAMGGDFIAVNDDRLVETQSAAIVYNLNSGSLFYNQNGFGAGFGSNGGEFASLLSLPTLEASNFMIVT